ncbi:hypothetical protein B9Q01_03675 [Candidatus Marsarchaeota G1 archaeon OSP_D]|jgi:Iron-sulfur cluster assembly accessory protein|uniref:Core domain-containing protein n=4 Tax=Candidatus Marsarchaeota group 1 TaxID=2203770 RepID=A0A2R6AJ62_9ARCH|nr:MAG: hypothetical protein B9Q01_03675 [Candidatus Marsarchaeota G1 archaeon OSP_D]PSN86378.1 MAG: hypothetical protein B9Q02_02495 [Candidatus Marsarchaeota G1 archaeon BE_D]PSN88526.1 MAG: hypothetical protein B9Q00_05125 [Candidatus Marsarchaeota G1 archaeon OSP_C]
MAEIELKSEAPVITLTERAANRIKQIITQNNKLGYGLRVFVRGGGCSGLTYGMSLEKEPLEGDYVVEQFGVKVFVDRYSSQFIKGSTIDYVETLQSSGFKIDNPNAVQSCGCGQSFRTTARPGKIEKCH